MFQAILQSIIRSTKRRMPGLPGLPASKQSSENPQKDRTSLILILMFVPDVSGHDYGGGHHDSHTVALNLHASVGMIRRG